MFSCSFFNLPVIKGFLSVRAKEKNSNKQILLHFVLLFFGWWMMMLLIAGMERSIKGGERLKVGHLSGRTSIHPSAETLNKHQRRGDGKEEGGWVMGRNQQVGKETEGRDGNVEDGNEDQRRVLTVFLTTGFCFKGSECLCSYHSSVFVSFICEHFLHSVFGLSSWGPESRLMRKKINVDYQEIVKHSQKWMDDNTEWVRPSKQQQHYSKNHQKESKERVSWRNKEVRNQGKVMRREGCACVWSDTTHH